MLYKGHLLVQHQIVESSRIQSRVQQVELYFSRWLRHMQMVITQGQQLRRDPPDVGPHMELEYWQQQLARYTSIGEFVTSKPFLHHLSCLELSKSPLIHRWKAIEARLSSALYRARDNVRYVGSLFDYWDPLYRCSPERMVDYLKSLMITLRNVYLTSRYYNTTECVSGFLVKVTNQLTLACKDYLLDNGKTGLSDQDPSAFIAKVEVCERLLQHYRTIYYETAGELEKMSDKVEPWHCSPTYLFGVMDKFRKRMHKIRQVLVIEVEYRVLKKIRISGMDRFERMLEVAHDRMMTRPYMLLDQQVQAFDNDYLVWNSEVEAAEFQMQQFVKETVAPIESAEGKLLVLKRFDRLKLDCLCMDRRYLDVFTVYEKELIDLKDT